VTSHIRLAAREDDIAAVKLNAGSADLVLGCDSLVTGDDLALSVMAPERSWVLVNTHQQITGHFTRDPDLQFPGDDVAARIVAAAGGERVKFVDATRLATRLLGDSIATNLFMVGYAYQLGLIPVAADSIDRAIELNGVAVEMNRAAFAWGRRVALDPDAVQAIAEGAAAQPAAPEGLDEIVAHRAGELAAYQDAAYAERYRRLVERVRQAEADKAPGMDRLALTVARYAYKLMAYKDEYEVARLYTDGRFEEQLKRALEGDFTLQFHMAPPLLTRRDPETGLRDTRTCGAWMLKAMRLLAGLRRLRGTPFDVFGYGAERRAERHLIEEYVTTIDELIAGLDHENHALAVEIAALPEAIRGYGHVKERHMEATRADWRALLETWRRPEQAAPRAAE
jgi:indolepyruvate ferredoxin oxidoreductase